MTEPNLFDNTEPTVLGELERVVKGMTIDNSYQDSFREGYNCGISDVLSEIQKRKPTEIEKLKQAFAEGYIQTESAESWARKFRQGGG